MQPNFFIVGAPKCGTTAWVKYLGQHPDVYFSPIKEPHYFATDLPRRHRIERLDDYLRLFNEGKSAKITAEASVRYLHSKVAAKNIREFNREAKILIFVRDRLDYLISWHRQLLFNGDDIPPDFGEVWRLSGACNSAPVPKVSTRYVPNYREEALFSPKVERFFAEFPADQIRVIHFDDWTRTPREAYLEILRFLGLEDDGQTMFSPVNEARQHRTRFVLKLVREPPRALRAAVTLLKKVTGRPALGLADLALRLDSRKAARIEVETALQEEIRAYFAEDNLLLDKRLWKPSRRKSAGGAGFQQKCKGHGQQSQRQ